jgi:hypothetical protein
MRGGIKKVADLFESYKKRLRAPEASVIACFCEVAGARLSVPVAPRDVQYRPQSRTLVIRASGPLRSEILLASEEIVRAMRERLGAGNAPEHII